MSEYSPSIKLASNVAEVKERSDPEQLLRQTIRNYFGNFFDPYVVTFFTNYRVIDQYADGAVSTRFLEVLVKVECKGAVGRSFHGEVVFAQRKFAAMMFEDCDLMHLGDALRDYVAIKPLPITGAEETPRLGSEKKWSKSIYEAYDAIDAADRADADL